MDRYPGVGVVIAKQLARAYAAAVNAPDDPVVRRAWAALGEDSHRMADTLRSVYDVRETYDPESYANAGAMFRDLDARRFVVSRANSEHPLWCVETNVAFRIVHDVLGHGISRGGFDWRGESSACDVHERLVSTEALPALLVECRAQTAYAIVNGAFAPQKVYLP